jgi:hypothetical protein
MCFFLIIHLFIRAYIVWAISAPLPPAPVPSLSSAPSSLPSRTCSVLFSNFVEEKTWAIVRHSGFASWGKDNYTERFLALLPRTSVLNPNWFISTWSLHYFPVTFPYWTLSFEGYWISSSAVGTSNTFKFWVSYLSPFLLYVLSP